MAKAIKEMMFDKKPTYEDLEKQIEALKFENEQVYKKLYDNSTISIWNEDFTLVFEEIEKIKTLKIVDVNKYLNENPEVVFLLLEKLKINSVNQATLKIFRACSKEDFINNVHRTFGNGATEVFIKLILEIINHPKIQNNTNTNIERESGNRNKLKKSNGLMKGLILHIIHLMDLVF